MYSSRSRVSVPKFAFAFVATAFSFACGGGDTHTTPITPSQVVGAVQVLPVDPTVDVGTTTAMTANVFDTQGKQLTGKVVTWSSSNTAVFTVEATTGIVHAVSAGSGIITANCESKTGTVAFTVSPAPLVSVAIVAPSAFIITAGQKLSLSTTLKDRTGATVTGRSVVWSSSASKIASVDANGVVSALSAGAATITATAEGLTGSITFTIAAPAGAVAPTITSVTPATQTPGGTVTITGANFFDAANNLVYVGGVLAAVTSSTPTQITATVSKAYACATTKAVGVDVTTPAGTASSTTSLKLGTGRTLAVGESFLASDGSTRACNELPANGTYLVSVFNASTVASNITAVELTGAFNTPSGSLASRDMAVAAMPKIISRAAVATPRVDAMRASAAREHADQLRFNIETFKRLGSPRQYARVPRVAMSALRASASASPATPTALAVVPTTIGDSTTINFYRNSCSIGSATKLSARVVYYGPKAIVLEDKASPLAGKVDDDLIAIAREWETVSYPALVKNLADPLAYDAKTDNNGRIIMFFTPQVNNVSAGLLGFVQGCDFYPPTVASASNQAEIFYARAITDTTASSTSLNGRPVWRRQMPATVAHETKHIASFASRFAASNNPQFEEIWLEEATAQIAPELYGRAIHGNSWKSDAGYNGVLECELKPLDPTCNGSVLAMYNNFGWLESYYHDVETASLISGNSADGESLYGGSWLLVRWLADTYGGSDEGAFLSSIVKNFQTTGVDNLVQRSGKTWPEILSQFTLMLAADDMASVGSPYVEASWNLPAIWTGYNGVRSDFSAKPLSIRQADFGTFSANVAGLKGGSAMLVRLGGTAGTGTQLLDLHESGGGVLTDASKIGIAILRIQ